MPTALYTTDVQKITDRTPKTTLTDTDVFVVANSSGTLAPITKVNTKETLGINANATAITTLNGDVSTAGSVLKVVKDNAKDATFTPTGTIAATDIKGAIAEVSLDVDKLNDTVAVEGSVLKSIKDNAQNATYNPTASGLTATTVKTAIDELADEKVSTGTTPSFNGVTFPATQVPSADPNTLDDYEEGTWTPVLTRATTPSAHTYTKQNGRYVKIGRKITVWFDITISATTTAGSGQNRITGIPFAPASGISYYASGDFVYSSLLTALAGMIALPSQIYLHFVSTNVTLGAVNENWGASGNMVGKIEYLV